MIPRELLEAAVALRGVQPELWAVFLRSMKLYAAGITSDMMRADPSLLMRAQGMAIQANEIADMLITAPQALEKIKGLKNNG